jgi:hypothetical protein
MCNVPIYFCNIDIQRLQHTLKTSRTLENTVATSAFSVAYACWFDEWRLIDAEHDVGMELENVE